MVILYDILGKIIKTLLFGGSVTPVKYNYKYFIIYHFIFP